jgi:signal transduction histidine kinase
MNVEAGGNPGLGDPASLYHSLFDGSSLPMAIVSGASHVVCYANPAFVRMIAKNEDELIGKRFADLAQEERVLSFLDRIYRTGEAETYSEPEYSETPTVYGSYAMWPVLGTEERPVGVVIQVTETATFHRRSTDINQELMLSAVRQHEVVEEAEQLNAQLQHEMAERKRAERALLNSEKLAATARLASTMSHEINNPLAAITNLVYLLGPLQTSSKGQSYIASLENQVKGLARIATQMLKFHRDNNHPTEFSLAELLNEVLEFYCPEALKQKIGVTQRIETEGRITGYRGEIVQVVSNLLLNAMEATSAGGRVGIHLYPAPPWFCEIHGRCGYCLAIADTGRGIDRQDYARIFEPFFTTKGDKGTGLGLWLCTSIVNRVGGSIRVWSGRGGSCFSVFLPADEATFTPLRRRYEQEDLS